MQATKSILAAAVAALGLAAAGPASAATEGADPNSYSWSHAGIFGTFDRAAVQRGFLVYRDVCASCHSLRFVALRTLQDIGLSEETVKAIAADFTVIDGPDDTGEMFERPGRPSDRIPPPFPNPQAAAAANGGAVPPDLSLIVKARKGHENYVKSLLVGYAEPPADVELTEGTYYNPYFPGAQIKMAPPLNPGQIEYPDGTRATVDQMAHDVTAFLAWTAEPSLETRKRMGVKVILFLLVLAGVLYAVKKKVWADVR